jgi:uncharacterized protein YndB with AHSA1/START domain
MDHSQSLSVIARDDLEIEITRTFDAPPELVFEAYSRPELLKRWLTGPPGWEMTVCEGELRPGASFRCEWRGPGDAVMVMSGVYREVVEPTRIVRTERFETGCEHQAAEQLATLTLEEHDDGRTTLMRLRVLYPTREARDGALASGMEQGLDASYASLDATLGELARR